MAEAGITVPAEAASVLVFLLKRGSTARDKPGLEPQPVGLILPLFFLAVFQVRTRRLLCYIYYCLNTKHVFVLLHTQQISHYKGSVNLEECHPVDSTSSLQNAQRNIVFLGFLF
jgi:hypothetical protein